MFYMTVDDIDVQKTIQISCMLNIDETFIIEISMAFNKMQDKKPIVQEWSGKCGTRDVDKI